MTDDLIIATIRSRVRRFMLEELEENGFREEFSDDASLVEKQVLDSLSILKLISFLDERYGIYLSEEEIDPSRLETVNLIANLIREKLPSR